MTKKQQSPIIFLSIAFILPLITGLINTKVENDNAEIALYLLGAAAPTLAAFITALITRVSLKSFFSSKKILISIIAPAIIAFTILFLSRFMSSQILGESIVMRMPSTKQLIIICWALIAEEFGWRGFLEPYFNEVIPTTELIPLYVGLIWSLWNYHYFVFYGLKVPIIFFALGHIAESYIYNFLMKITDGNIISACVFHFSMDLFIRLYTIQPVYNNGNELPYQIYTIVEVITLVIIIIISNSAGFIRNSKR